MGLWDLLPHTGPAVPDSLESHGKTHQVWGFPAWPVPGSGNSRRLGARATESAPLLWGRVWGSSWSQQVQVGKPEGGYVFLF